MNSHNDIIRVVDGPARIGGVPCRLVQLADGSGRVESFVHGAWRTGGCTLHELLIDGTPCPDPETGARPV